MNKKYIILLAMGIIIAGIAVATPLLLNGNILVFNSMAEASSQIPLEEMPKIQTPKSYVKTLDRANRLLADGSLDDSITCYDFPLQITDPNSRLSEFPKYDINNLKRVTLWHEGKGWCINVEGMNLADESKAITQQIKDNLELMNEMLEDDLNAMLGYNNEIWVRQ